MLDYFVFERVQLYTYDLIHEKLGFMLIWGGLVVYGWLFALPLWGMAALPDPGFPPAWTTAWLVGTAALFLFGWSISRGANLQKYTFKRWPDRKFLGLIEPDYIEAGERKILCSGLWGVARHFNYLGEGFLSLSIALVFGYPGNPWAWTYFVFIVSLFLWRQRADDRHCARKYGPENWAELPRAGEIPHFPRRLLRGRPAVAAEIAGETADTPPAGEAGIQSATRSVNRPRTSISKARPSTGGRAKVHWMPSGAAPRATISGPRRPWISWTV